MDDADFKANNKFTLLIWNIKTRIGENVNNCMGPVRTGFVFKLLAILFIWPVFVNPPVF